MVQIGDTVHYISRGSADGKYPQVHVPLLVTRVHDICKEHGGELYPLVDGWTFNSHGQRFEENVFPSVPETPTSEDANWQGGEWHYREGCEWTGEPRLVPSSDGK